jgi:YidC/Oxa1 family membrane protein insertase
VEGLVHLERISSLKEPEDLKSKAHYYDGLVLLASTLYNLDRKDEAAKYLRMATAYSPDYKPLLEQCENSNDDDGFVSNLAETRRRDY